MVFMRRLRCFPRAREKPLPLGTLYFDSMSALIRAFKIDAFLFRIRGETNREVDHVR